MRRGKSKATTAAGLGIALRTPFGLPARVRELDSVAHGLPRLPALGLALLHWAEPDSGIAAPLAAIIRQALQEALPEAWMRKA